MPDTTPVLRKPMPPSLPETVDDFRAQRKSQLMRTLNDQVEEIHLSLYENEEYGRYLYAVYDEQAVEGSLGADNVKAAEMIRQLAKERGNIVVAREKLATISKALGVVLRRYNQDRKTRRNMVHGEIVRSGNGDEQN